MACAGVARSFSSPAFCLPRSPSFCAGGAASSSASAQAAAQAFKSYAQAKAASAAVAKAFLLPNVDKKALKETWVLVSGAPQ